MIPSNPLLQIFIVRNTLPYEELNSLPSDLRGLLGENNVLITKANYRMLSELIDSIKPQENNLILLLTQDIELDGNLQQQFNQIKSKNIRLILYPQELSKDNQYLVTKSKQDIINAAMMYFKIVQGKSQIKAMNSSQQSGVRTSQMKASPHQPLVASSFKPLSELANQSHSPIGLFALRSKDKQFNSLMNLLHIKHKNNPLINFQQILSFESLQVSKNQKQILVVSEKEANQMESLTPYLGNLDSKVFAIRFLDKRGIRKPNTNFHFETNKIEDIEYLVDTSLAKLQNNTNQRVNNHNQRPFNSSIYDRPTSRNGRIQMKSAKKINNMFSPYQKSLFIYDKNQSAEFQQFYSNLPFSYHIISSLDHLQSYPIILAPSSACPLIFSQIPNNSKLVLYANTLTPDILINHPLITMASSNKNELINYFKSESIPMKSINPPHQNSMNQMYAAPGVVSPSSSELKSKQYHPPSVSTENPNSLQWTVRYDGINYQTLLDTSPSKEISEIRMEPSELSNELRQTKNMRISQVLQVQEIQYHVVEEIRQLPQSEYVKVENMISPERIEEFVIKSARKSVINQNKQVIPSMPTFTKYNENENVQWFQSENEYQLNKENIDTNIMHPYEKEETIRKQSIPEIIINPPYSDKGSNISQIQYFPPLHQPNQPVSIKVINELPSTRTNIPQVSRSIPMNNTITFNQYSEKDRRTESINDGPILSPYTMGDIDSLVSIPERIYTEKAISCQIFDTPGKDERNVLGLAASLNEIKNVPSKVSLEYQMNPVQYLPRNLETEIVYSNQETIFINKHIAKKQEHQKLCSGVFQIRTEGEAQVLPTLSSSTFINNVSGKSEHPLVERIIIDSPKVSLPPPIHNPISAPIASPISSPTPVPNPVPIIVTPPSEIVNTRTSSIHQIAPYTAPQTQHRQSQSLEAPPRHSYRFSNISQVPSVRLSYEIQEPLPYIDINPKRESRLQLNELNFDVRTENGVKVYKRKSQSVDNNFISSSMLREIQPANNTNLRADHYYNKDQKPSLIKQQRHSSYYNNENYTPVNTHRLSSIKNTIPRESKILGTEVQNSRFYKGKVSGFVQNVPRISNVVECPPEISNSSLFSVVRILLYRGEQELENGLKVRLKNKVSLSSYHNLESLMHQTVKYKDENLVVILNEELRLLDEEIEDIHPNVSIITYSKSVTDGTHVANSVPEVLSLIEKWYFKY